MLKQIVEISEEIALVERQLGISLPASQQTASKMLEEDVEQVYAPSPHAIRLIHGYMPPPLTPLVVVVEQVSAKEYDVTDDCAACMGCCCTCGLAGICPLPSRHWSLLPWMPYERHALWGGGGGLSAPLS